MSFDIKLKLMENTYVVHVYGTKATNLGLFKAMEKVGTAGNYLVAVTHRQYKRPEAPSLSYRESKDSVFEHVLVKDQSEIYGINAQIQEHVKEYSKLHRKYASDSFGGKELANEMIMRALEEADVSALITNAFLNKKLNVTAYFPETETKEMRRIHFKAEKRNIGKLGLKDGSL